MADVPGLDHAACYLSPGSKARSSRAGSSIENEFYRPHGRAWRQGDYRNSNVSVAESGLGQRLMVRGPLLGEGDADFRPWRKVVYTLAAGIPRLDIRIGYDRGSDRSRIAWLFFEMPLALKDAVVKYGSTYCAIDYKPLEGDQGSLRRIRSVQDWLDLYEGSTDTAVTVAGPSTQFEIRPDGFGIALVSRHGSTPGNLCIGMDGFHRFRYSIRAHRGDWRTGMAFRAGAEREAGTSPLRAVLASPRGAVLPPAQKVSLPVRKSLLDVAGDAFVVTALKQAHAGEDLVLRGYEATGKDLRMSILNPREQYIVGAQRSNILEDEGDPLTLDKLAKLALKLWEILSLRLRMAPRGAEAPSWKK